MKKLLFISVLLFFGTFAAVAQRTLSGTVADEKGEPLIGATVIAKGTAVGTVTDIDGRFSLNAPNGASTLVISYAGYTTQELSIGANNVMNIKLAQGVLLTETVVTALGVSRAEKSLGYATQTVGGDQILQSNTTNIVDALGGKAAGVQISSSSGAAGASSSIIIRGQTTLNGNNQALFVVDGLKVDNSAFQTEGATAGVSQSNRAIDIDPANIESITVLKGAAASALYGIDGARGVVLITTKKGGSKKGKGITVEYSNSFTITQANKFPQLQSTFAKGTGGAYRGSTSTTSTSFGPRLDTMYFDGVPTEYDPNGSLVGKSNPLAKLNLPAKAYNPLDFFQNGHGWQNSVALNGGSVENTTYRLSFSAHDETGIVPLNTFKRTNVALSSSSNLFDNRFHISTTLSYINSPSRRTQQGSNVSGLMLGLLRTPPSFDNSGGVSDPVNNPKSYYYANGTQRNYRIGAGYDNPYWVINNDPYTDEVNRFIGGINATYDIYSWLKINGRIGTDVYEDNRVQNYEINSRSFPAGRVVNDNYTYKNLDAYLSLLGTVNLAKDFSLNYDLGFNSYSQTLRNITVTGDGLSYPGYLSLNNTSTKNIGLFNDTRKNAAVYGSLDFGYRNFLYLTVTGRNDWVSTLIVPSKPFNASDIAIFYPSVSGSFVFSELMNRNNVFTFGKIRLSYGVVGGGAPGPYQTSTNYGVPLVTDGFTTGISFPYGGSLTGLTYGDTKGSTTLVPSKTTDYEAGLELKFFKNRIRLDASYYTRKSIDQIVAVPIAVSSGFANAVLNSGQLSTKGFDIILGLTPVVTKNFKWDIDFNFTHWKTIVDKLADGVNTQFLGGFSNGGTYNVVGMPYAEFYGSAYERVNSSDGKTFDPTLPYNPKGALVIDADKKSSTYGQPLVDQSNSRALGNTSPDFLLGVNNSFSFYGFTVSALLDVRSGGVTWNGTRGALNNFGASLSSAVDRGTQTVLPGVKSSDGSVNDIPLTLGQAYYQGNGSGFTINEPFIESSAFIRLRQVNVAYRFPNSLLGHSGLSDLTLNFTGRNLWLKTDYTGVDPETSLTGNGNSQGLDYFNSPGTKSWAFGLGVKF